jgi:hypothetical protein
MLNSLEDSTMELNTVSNFNLRNFGDFLSSDFKDTTKAFTRMESVYKTLNLIKSIKVVSNEFVNR